MQQEELSENLTMEDALVDVSHTLNHITDAFAVLDECIEQFVEFPAQPDIDFDEMKYLIQKISQHGHYTEGALAEIKESLRNDINQHVIASCSKALKTNSANWIRDEVARQVKEQVDLQIVEHLLESLRHQADESKRQLEGIKISLTNSESRMTNSFIQSSNVNDPLAVILTSDGKRSPLYPANTRCLFGYDLDSVKELCKDYDLAETEDRLMNFRQFLKHIGTNVEVLVSPV